MNPNEFIHDLDQQRVVAAIREAESKCRGEIRVHIDSHPVSDPRPAAFTIFAKLGIANTAEKNGVLIFIAPKTTRFAVMGDTAIDDLVGESFWVECAESLESSFAGGDYTRGIVAVIGKVGEALAAHFPRRPGEDDENELPDSISTG
jgi:uncharacterized membrane protein